MRLQWRARVGPVSNRERAHCCGGVAEVESCCTPGGRFTVIVWQEDHRAPAARVPPRQHPEPDAGVRGGGNARADACHGPWCPPARAGVDRRPGRPGVARHEHPGGLGDGSLARRSTARSAGGGDGVRGTENLARIQGSGAPRRSAGCASTFNSVRERCRTATRSWWSTGAAGSWPAAVAG